MWIRANIHIPKGRTDHQHRGGQDDDKEEHEEDIQDERLDLHLQREHDEQLGMAGRLHRREGPDPEEADAAAPQRARRLQDALHRDLKEG